MKQQTIVVKDNRVTYCGFYDGHHWVQFMVKGELIVTTI